MLADFHQANVDAYTKAGQGEQLNIINCYRHKDGSPRWISWTAAPDDDVIDANGRDITAEREQAAALANAEEALRQSQKMAAVGQRTGGPAHDFNGLPTGVTGKITVESPVGAAGLWTTLVDPGRLENALLDLCINACDAMPAGGKITIETANR